MKMDMRNILTVTLFLALCVSTSLSQKRKKHKKLKDPEAPSWKSNSKPAKKEMYESINEGQSIKLDCNAKGRPKPKIHWRKNGEKLHMDGARIKARKYELKLHELAGSDSGNYTCIVKNSQGQLQYTFIVDVAVKIWPLEVEGPSNLTVPEGQTVKFRCRVLNDPEATIRWLKRKPISADILNKKKPDFIETSGKEDPELMVIKNVKVKDAGQYTCLAGNLWGLKYMDAWLTVIPTGNSPTVSLQTVRPTTMPVTTPKPRRRHTTAPSIWNWTNPPPRQTTFIWNPYPTHKPSRGGKNHDHGGRKRKPPRRKDKKTTVPSFGTTTTTEMFEFQTIRRVETGRDRDMYDPRLKENNPRLKNEDPRDKKPKSKDGEGKEGKGKKNKEGKNTKATGLEERNTKGMISLWTIYTIVGAIAGVILLLGLIAITVALCCRKDSNGVYKSTRV
ncbi:fibroblast growth factor receptor-like 1 [Gigantopelta aegis]|uniref:fibroblast growth factor receptor-like 1 n=1 Tax=Gigantopelta aegis TaxID=1735272 RepID=UPI001B88B434|nr:fibroblast growth factor receptor-like 1 [Gigantopelta aegis]XP_041367713.1 fibroblast growth factor receptor-like 1 [Gigantopelta aegis]